MRSRQALDEQDFYHSLLYIMAVNSVRSLILKLRARWQRIVLEVASSTSAISGVVELRKALDLLAYQKLDRSLTYFWSRIRNCFDVETLIYILLKALGSSRKLSA